MKRLTLEVHSQNAFIVELPAFIVVLKWRPSWKWRPWSMTDNFNIQFSVCPFGTDCFFFFCHRCMLLGQMKENLCYFFVSGLDNSCDRKKVLSISRDVRVNSFASYWFLRKKCNLKILWFLMERDGWTKQLMIFIELSCLPSVWNGGSALAFLMIFETSVLMHSGYAPQIQG